MRTLGKISDVIGYDLVVCRKREEVWSEVAKGKTLAEKRRIFPRQFEDGGSDPLQIERTRRRLRKEGMML